MLLGDTESILDGNARLMLSNDTPSAYLTEDTFCFTVTVAVQDTSKVGIVSIPLVGVSGHEKDLEVADVIRTTPRTWYDMIDMEGDLILIYSA